MPFSFRLVPPEVPSGSLRRPRLLQALSHRWDRRVTVVAGGAGLGKTTVLAQAVAENHLRPRGEDVWIGVGTGDPDGARLAGAVARAVGLPMAPASGDEAASAPVDPARAAAALWRRSPAEVCVFVDDVHLVAPGSAGAAWLGALVDALPGNGHLVLATRRVPLPLPLPLARLTVQREVQWIDEQDLRFDADELVRFATERGVDPDRLAGTGGWPALAELTVATGHDLAGAFLGEEVLAPLGDRRRRVLTVLCDLGGADDALASATLGHHVDLATELAGVPLVERTAEGWHVPHDLWRRTAGLTLAEDEQATLRRRAVDHLRARGRLEPAFELLARAGLWDQAPPLLREAALASDDQGARRLGRWLTACPAAVSATPAGLLATALSTHRTTPAAAVEPLHVAAAAGREAGDVEVELCALAHLGRLGWFRQDLTTLRPEEAARVAELAAAGHVQAEAIAAFGRAVVADLGGDDDAVLAELAGIRSGALHPTWEVMAAWLFGMVHLGLGDLEPALDLVARFGEASDPAVRAVVAGVRMRTWWSQGRVDDVLADAPRLVEGVRAHGVASGRHMALTNASVLYAHVGDVATARRLLDEGTATASPGAMPGQQVRTALATGALLLAEGDADGAAATFRQVAERHGLDRGADRRGWRMLLATTYVLLPETRAYWDERPLRGHLHTARRLAALLVAGGEGDGARRLRRTDLPDLGTIRSALPLPYAAELAAALAGAGRSVGAELLEALGPAGRRAARTLAADRAPVARHARALLAALPAPPTTTVHVVTLGALALHGGRFDGPPLAEPDLRRQRVRELLAFLVGHRRTTRATVAAALWPDLDAALAGNNLSVTLNYLLRVLEPRRSPGEAGYLLRVDGSRIRLVTGAHLRVDTDEFDEHRAAAERAETDGVPSVALEHQLAAVALYHGDLFGDLGDQPWLVLDREHYRSRFVATATRAAELLLGHGDVDPAEQRALDALRVDPSAEAAHAVLIAGALRRGDRPTAGRRLRDCLDTLADLGLAPSSSIDRMRRRLLAPTAGAAAGTLRP